MAGLPWIKVYTDLPRDPRSLHLADLLSDARAWTYVLEMRLYFAEHAPTGTVSGPGAVATVERSAGWTGERGALIEALRDAGFVRAGPARDGEGTEVFSISDLDWQKQQGAHVAKVHRDAMKPRGKSHNVVSPSRDIGGTGEGPAPIPRGESRDKRVESREERSPASQVKATPSQAEDFELTPPPASKPKKKSAAQEVFEGLQEQRKARCVEVGEPVVEEHLAVARQNHAFRALVEGKEDQELFEAAWSLYLADDANRPKEPAWSVAYFMSSGVRAKYETRAAREAA